MSDDTRPFLARAEQILENVSVAAGGKAHCSATGKTLRPGEVVTVHCARDAQTVHWTRVGVFLPAAAPDAAGEGEPSTSDAILATGRLAVASDPETRKPELILREVDVLDVHRGDDR